MAEKPRYWDSWRGQILRAIIIDGAETWSDVFSRAGLEQRKMYKVVGELTRAKVISYSKEDGFRVLDDGLVASYKGYTGQESAVEETPTELVSFLASWIDSSRDCSANLTGGHFFLDGPNLAELTRKLIGEARSSIRVVNPYVDRATLGKALRDAARNCVRILLVTRWPNRDMTRREFHKSLLEEGVDLRYLGDERSAGGVHSKVIVFDDQVAVISSMNFTSYSESYNYEAGIVSIDREVIDSTIEFIVGIRDEPETKLGLALHQR